MGQETHSFEATSGLTAVDAFKVGVKTGSTTAKSIVVPAGKPHLAAIIGIGTSDGAATGASSFLVRLGGSGLIRNADIFVSGFGATLATTHSTPLDVNMITDLGIQCTPGSEITVSFGMFGADSGTAEMAVTLFFSDRAPVGGWKEYISREVLSTTLDDAGELPLEGLGTATLSNIKVPGDATMLDRILAVAASDASTTGAGYTALRLSGSGLVFSSQELVIGASGGTHATEANGHSAVSDFNQIEFEIRPSNEIEATAVQGGAMTSSNVAVGVTFVFTIAGK